MVSDDLFLRAQDPDEWFDVTDANGRPTGRRKRRGEVHRDGDWHRAIHVWLLNPDPSRPTILFQRRGAAKDTWPNRLDATVGGHYRSGETRSQTLREIEEEIGVEPVESELLFAGIRVHASESEPGVLDRELQDVFLWPGTWKVESLQPNPDELESLVEIPLESLIDLLLQRSDSVPGYERSARDDPGREVLLQRDAFIPTIDRYPLRVALAARRWVAGDTDLVI